MFDLSGSPFRGWHIAIFLLLILLAVHPGTAMTFNGGMIVQNVTPGTTYVYPMSVSIGANEAATDVSVDVLGFGQNPSGTYLPLSPDRDTSPYSARTFTSVDNPSIHLDPGMRVGFNVTISVPKDVGTGGRYAIVYAHSVLKQMISGTGAAISTAYIAQIVLTISGTATTTTGSITDLQAVNAVTGEPVEIDTIVKNTGNYHFVGTLANVTIQDSTGKTVATASSSPFTDILVPGNEITLRAFVTPPLAQGTYTVKSDAKLASGMKLLDSKTATFTVSPPATPTTQAITQAPAVGQTTPVPFGTQPVTAAETTGPHKLWILPIYTPGPDALLTVGVLAAALFIWSRGRQG
jgi:hypothetical protein